MGSGWYAAFTRHSPGELASQIAPNHIQRGLNHRDGLVPAGDVESWMSGIYGEQYITISLNIY